MFDIICRHVFDIDFLMFCKRILSTCCKNWSPKVDLLDDKLRRLAPKGCPKRFQNEFGTHFDFSLVWDQFGNDFSSLLVPFPLPFRSHWLPSGKCLHLVCRFHAERLGAKRQTMISLCSHTRIPKQRSAFANDSLRNGKHGERLGLDIIVFFTCVLSLFCFVLHRSLVLIYTSAKVPYPTWRARTGECFQNFPVLLVCFAHLALESHFGSPFFVHDVHVMEPRPPEIFRAALASIQFRILVSAAAIRLAGPAHEDFLLSRPALGIWVAPSLTRLHGALLVVLASCAAVEGLALVSSVAKI
jgi:hypothetical protein